MTKLPKFLLSRMAIRQAAGGPHPDPGRLAAFAEQTLSAQERAALLEHLASCPECREILAVASVREHRQAPQIAWWNWRWVGAAAAACLIAALFWRPASVEKLNVKIAPPAPLPAMATTKKEEQPKPIAKPRTSSSSRPKPLAVAQQPPITLRQRVNLPLRTLNLTPSVATETASLKIPEANLGTQSDLQEKSAAPRTGLLAQNKTLGLAFRANAPESMARQTLLRNAEKSQWVLDETLRKSDDGGRTWTTVHVDDRAHLYALAVAGSDIWVGGADGALFHSIDGGQSWKPVVVTDSNTRLVTTITRIEARDANWIQLKTGSGDWLTTNGGLRWQQQ